MSWIDGLRPAHFSGRGAWFVKIAEAPFSYHMFVFHAVGTMQQANPDAGNAITATLEGQYVMP